MKKTIFILLMLVFSASVFAQSSRMSGFRRNFATVVFAGLGGAVLGLSTLSFYGSPQDHTSNIWTGLGLGVLGGIGYVAASPGPQSVRVDESYSLIDHRKPEKKEELVGVPLVAFDF